MKKFETARRLDRESVCMSVVSAVPDFLTIEEAAAILRIGRTAAYALGREYLATGGLSGLPVMRFGRLCGFRGRSWKRCLAARSPGHHQPAPRL
jgi:hypothetical protein